MTRRPAHLAAAGWIKRNASLAIAPAVFAALTLMMFYRLLFQTRLVVSADQTDLVLQFLPWRDFGFSQLRHGHLPLWNPYVFGGTPYFAGFQSALLYPPNWIHFLLSLLPAINWIVAIHVFLAGYFTSLWARGRGSGVAGSLIAGGMFMFGGTYFWHIYAGHLPHLAVMVWLPLLMLSVEKLAGTGRLAWCFLGTAAMTMALLAGHPQYIYYTGIITSIYTALLWVGCRWKRRLLGGFLLIMFGAACIAAVQLLSGFQAAGESVRSGGTSFEFASMFGLPPENLLTLIVPNFFGTLPTVGDPHPAVPYFGRCYLWEMSVFASITGLVLALTSATIHWRRHWRVLVVIAIALWLALGKHMPLYRTLFDYLPMYGSFRDVAKFTVFLSLFLSVLAADGFDLIMLTNAGRRYWSITITAVAVAIALFIGAQIVAADGAVWHGMMKIIADAHESFGSTAIFSDETMIATAAAFAAGSTRIAATIFLAIAAVVVASRYWRPSGYALILLALAELFAVASTSYSTTTGESSFPAAWLAAIRTMPTDQRLLNVALPGGGEVQFQNQGLSLGYRDIWGYDPGVLKRYAELLTASQGIPIDQASQYLQIQHGELGFFQMLRTGLALVVKDGRPEAIALSNPLPRAQLVPDWSLHSIRDDAIASVLDKSFDPRKSVVLQSRPEIAPSSQGRSGPADTVEVDTDTLEIHAYSPESTLLLISENYSSGWHATAIGDEPTVQDGYAILPANYAFMAIPLKAGAHHIRLQYRPAAFDIGVWVSVISLIIFCGTLAAWLLRARCLSPSPGNPKEGRGEGGLA